MEILGHRTARRYVIAILLVAVAFVGSAALVPRITSLSLAATGPSLTNLAQTPSPRNLTFYMHNNTLAKDVNGISTPYIFDTLQKFGQNNTITNLQVVREDWYLFPTLAGNLTVNGSITMDVFVSVSGTSPSLQSQTLTIYEVNATGVPTSVASLTFGSVPWFNTPHDLVLTIPGVHHTFPAGSSIRVLVDLQLGTRTGTIWYNASWVPTHLIVQSDDFAETQSLSFLDSMGVARQNFDPLAANKALTIVANVTDPLGGYDISWVNLTLVRPGGAVILAAVPMTKTAGTPLSYVSTYDYAWNYNGQPVGRYNATVGVLDNTGRYYFQEFFATGPYLAQLTSFFYIGGLPLYVNVKAVDSKSVALNGATINLLSGGIAIDAQTADTNGAANFTLAGGSYSFTVVWEAVQVASVIYDASANVSSANPIVINCSVYYPTFQAQDASGGALPDASLIFVVPNGQEIGPFKTDATGDVNLTQVPIGTYQIDAAWRGVSVYTGSAPVSGNGVIAFQGAVYELTVTVEAGNGQTLPGAFVSVVDSGGLVFDAGYTGSDGKVVLRLPAGSYTIDYHYLTTYQGSSYDSGTRSTSVQLTTSRTVTLTLSDFPIPFTSTLTFLFALVYGITVAAFLAVLYLFRRRKKGGNEAPKMPEPPKNE